jgi:hypothetical protein
MAFFSDSFGRLRMLSLSKQVARYNKDGLLRGHQMSGARPIKMPYTRDLATLAGFFDSTKQSVKLYPPWFVQMYSHERRLKFMTTDKRYEELKELLSYPEAIALLCFNINYSARFARVNLSVLAGFLGLEDEKLKKMSRVFKKLNMANIYKQGINTEIEMMEPSNDDVKDIIYEVIGENRDEYFYIYRRILAAEGIESLALN